MRFCAIPKQTGNRCVIDYDRLKEVMRPWEKRAKMYCCPHQAKADCSWQFLFIGKEKETFDGSFAVSRVPRAVLMYWNKESPHVGQQRNWSHHLMIKSAVTCSRSSWSVFYTSQINKLSRNIVRLDILLSLLSLVTAVISVITSGIQNKFRLAVLEADFLGLQFVPSFYNSLYFVGQ